MQIEIIVILCFGVLLLMVIGAFIIYMSRSNQQVARLKEEHEKELLKHEKELLKAQQDIQEVLLSYISSDFNDHFGNNLSTVNFNLVSIFSHISNEIDKKVTDMISQIKKLLEHQELQSHPVGDSTSGQVLTVLNLDLAAISCFSAQINEKAADAKVLVKQLITEIKEVVNKLTTNYITEHGLQKALEQELERLTMLKKSIEVKGKAFKMSFDNETVLFSIYQKILNEIVNSSKPTTITVIAEYLPGSLSLLLHFDGLPLNMDKNAKNIPDHKKIALGSIYDRARIINADIRPRPQSDNHNGISIFVPIA